MKKSQKIKTWEEVLDFPLSGREKKPRKKGMTMVIDKGLGLTEVKELLEMASDHIDFIKLGFGTSAFYATDILERKIEIVRSYGVDIYPGGTFLEVAVLQNKLKTYLETSRVLGYNCIEVSDGTISMSPGQRAEIILEAREMGFRVLSEVGKKDPRDKVSAMQIHRQIEEDLRNGAFKVIVEGRESGKGVVIYDASGAVKQDELDDMIKGLRQPEDILWEAPLKSQQQELILRLGCNVNLGNISSQEVLALEALRVGLRGDTLRTTLKEHQPQEKVVGANVTLELSGK